MSYDIGIDPGARNVGVASNDDSVFEPCTLDLGPLDHTSNSDVVRTLIESLCYQFSDPRLEEVFCEAGISDKFNSKRQLVSARLFLVQGALQSLSFSCGKRFTLVAPRSVKTRHWGDEWISGLDYNVNKQLAVSKCAELFGDHYLHYTDHACDAKLLAVWRKPHQCQSTRTTTDTEGCS